MPPLEIHDPSVIATSGSALHAIARRTGDLRDEVPGMAYRVNQAELAAADNYEVDDCTGLLVRLASGIDAIRLPQRSCLNQAIRSQAAS